jgi:hypothetical protein
MKTFSSAAVIAVVWPSIVQQGLIPPAAGTGPGSMYRRGQKARGQKAP